MKKKLQIETSISIDGEEWNHWAYCDNIPMARETLRELAEMEDAMIAEAEREQ